MKKCLLMVSGCFLFAVAIAQPFNKQLLQILSHKEDTMQLYADKMVNASLPLVRFQSDSSFTKLFVSALKTPYSFYYPFDSLQTISKLYAPDSAFRIFTWQLVVNENLTRQHGAIQMRTPDGSLKLFPLIDKSDITQNIADTTANNKGWIGAVYYKIIETKSMNQPFYTLLGYDENNIRSNRKIIEVLSFANDEPLFGGRYISFEGDSIFKSAASRYVMEYKKTAGARLTYDQDLKMIISEHLESETGETNKKWTYIPDGDYEGFKWQNGKWMHIEKVFTQTVEEGGEPVPKPVKDASGNTVEDNLKDNLSGEKAANTEDYTSPVKKKAVVKKPKTKNN